MAEQLAATDTRRKNIGGLIFYPYKDREEIRQGVEKLADTLSEVPEYQEGPLVLLAVLRGATVFAADLSRELEDRDIPHEVEFIQAGSYQGTTSSGEVQISKTPSIKLSGKHVLVAEDVADTCETIRTIHRVKAEWDVASLAVAVAFEKDCALSADVRPDYAAIRIGDEFIVGYGLDLDQQGRGLPDLWRTLSEPAEL